MDASLLPTDPGDEPPHAEPREGGAPGDVGGPEDARPSPLEAAAGDSPLSEAGNADSRAILKMLSGSPDARGELVADIRDQIEAGTYMTEEKVNLAVYRLLRDLLD